MPVYAYECPTCGNTADAYRKVDERHDAPRCLTPACYNGAMLLRIRPAMVAPDIPDYVSPVTGKLVSGRKQRVEDLKRSGCRPYEGREQEEKEAARRRRYAEDADSQALERKAHEVFNGLPRDAQRALEGQ